MQLAMQRALDPTVLQLGLGFPAPELYPTNALADAAAQVLGSASGLQYGPPEKRLKEQIVELMGTRGVTCTTEEVFLTSGAQQALTLLARLFSRFGTRALVSDVLYTPFRQSAERAVETLVPVRVDTACVIDLDHVARELSGRDTAFLYAMSAGHNPTGVTMTESARHALVDLAVRHHVPIIEDDVYGFLQYEPALEPPMRALDDDWVFYVGSLSKLLGPSLRVGWIVAPSRWASELSVLKEAADLDVATVSQRIVGRYLDTCSMVDRIQALRAAYRARRDALCAALSAHCSSLLRWEIPRCGFFVWAEAVGVDDTERILGAAIDQGVTFVPGSAFSVAVDGRHRRFMRLSFSCCAADQIDRAVSLLRQVFTR